MKQLESGFLNMSQQQLEAHRQKAEADLASETLSKSQANSIYGQVNVKCWIQQNLIHPVKMQGGSKKFIDRLKLEAVARASNRHI